jgi:hypothetical protein
MTLAVRWTEDQLADFERRRKEFKGVDIDAVHSKPRPAPSPVKESKIERRFAQQLAESGLPGHQRNYFFLHDRDLELDFAWPGRKVAVEIQGMAHRIKGKFKRDIEKRALALLAGWKLLELDGASVRDGRGLEWLRQLLG